MLQRKLFFQDLPVFQTYPQPHDFEKATELNVNCAQLENTKFSTFTVYIPFCERLCSFCGLNTTISRDHAWDSRYLELLKLELNQKEISFDQFGELRTILLTGGTPHFIPPKKLMGFLTEIKALQNGPNTILEVDPRTMSTSQLIEWITLGITEVQFGVQDLSQDVQKQIGRYQTSENLKELIEVCHHHSINWGVDFILGLPGQTFENLIANVDFVRKFCPQRVQIYNFRKVPWMTTSQSLLDHSLVPNAELLYGMAKQWSVLLKDLSYEEIGFGTWAKNCELADSLKTESLDFGPSYWTPHSQAHSLGIGVSSFSQNSKFIFQNEKTLPLYERELQRGQTIIQRFHLYSESDTHILDLRKKIVNNQWWSATAELINESKIEPADIVRDLSLLVQADWIIEKNKKYKVKDRRVLGLLFAIFDPYIRQRHPKFLQSRLVEFL